MARDSSAYAVKLHQLLFGLIVFIVGFSAVKAMAWGSTVNLQKMVSIIIVIGIVLALDKYYWALCPLMVSLGTAIPGLPFSGTELGYISLIGVYFVRLAVRKENSIKITKDIIIAVPFFSWVCFIWVLNPTGMDIFGSTSIGARFYVDIVLGFIILFVLSTLRFSENNCKALFYILLCTSLYAVISSVFFKPEYVDQELAGTSYENLAAFPLYVLIMSRYGLTTIISSLFKFGTVLVLAYLLVASGKRRTFALMMLFPFYRVFFTRRDFVTTFCCSIVACIALLFLVAGHEVLYELPRSVQRSLAIIVPKFAQDYGGTRDTFRENMRDQAIRIIKKDPWFGRKGFAIDRGEIVWVNSGSNMYEGHALAGNWHSTWYAFAADFGLPACFFWGIFIIYVVRRCYNIVRIPGVQTFSFSCLLFFTFSIYGDTLFSYTSGHSSLTPFVTWYEYGMILAIRNGIVHRMETKLIRQ